MKKILISAVVFAAAVTALRRFAPAMQQRAMHGEQDTPQLREQLRSMLKDETAMARA